ncbi:hypothetical protein R4Z10_20595 [Niallia sp. XMNu-256]|uniref:hypothetical protein n=1 Tax=Niallia sp. XMNu-256 TaxID=3082444 RepID=UPI0030CF0BE3
MVAGDASIVYVTGAKHRVVEEIAFIVHVVIGAKHREVAGVCFYRSSDRRKTEDGRGKWLLSFM